MTTFRQQEDGIYVIDKAPDASLKYGLDWAAAPPFGPWLAEGDTIVSASVVVAPGLVAGGVELSPAEAPTVTMVRLSGGQLGSTYLVTISITTSQGNTDSRSFRVHIAVR